MSAFCATIRHSIWLRDAAAVCLAHRLSCDVVQTLRTPPVLGTYPKLDAGGRFNRQTFRHRQVPEFLDEVVFRARRSQSNCSGKPAVVDFTLSPRQQDISHGIVNWLLVSDCEMRVSAA